MYIIIFYGYVESLNYVYKKGAYYTPYTYKQLLSSMDKILNDNKSKETLENILGIKTIHKDAICLYELISINNYDKYRKDQPIKLPITIENIIQTFLDTEA